MNNTWQENNITEFKEVLNEGLEKEVVAFLNSAQGGDIFIGVKDDGTIVGINNVDKTVLAISDRIKNNILPSCLGLFDIRREEHEGKILIHIIVARGTERPYYLKHYGQSPKGCFVRVGNGVQPMTTSMIEQLYAGTDKIDLIENEEYGFCSLLKATHRVLDKLEIENTTFTRITGAAERQQHRLFEPRALREAVINAIIHNDYSFEVPPVIEIYSDRISITSYGGLVSGLSIEDCLNGRSMPRNREIMRVFRDMDLVEQIGSGVRRILNAYDRSVFKISENFFEICLPNAESLYAAESVKKEAVTGQVTGQVTEEIIRLVKAIKNEATRTDLMQRLELSSRANFVKLYLAPALEAGLIEMTIPDKPNSRLQKYRVTALGKATINAKSSE